ncbi:MAG: hypothetical protein U0232_19370 [Thermomicrobiales bacterium]
MGVGEGGGAVAVGKVDVGSGGDEEADDFGVVGAAVAEDDGFEEGSPAEAVDVVDGDVGGEEFADDFDVAASAARMRPVPL